MSAQEAFLVGSIEDRVIKAIVTIILGLLHYPSVLFDKSSKTQFLAKQSILSSH